jgi:hypothetical protein
MTNCERVRTSWRMREIIASCLERDSDHGDGQIVLGEGMGREAWVTVLLGSGHRL